MKTIKANAWYYHAYFCSNIKQQAKAFSVFWIMSQFSDTPGKGLLRLLLPLAQQHFKGKSGKAGILRPRLDWCGAQSEGKSGFGRNEGLSGGLFLGSRNVKMFIPCNPPCLLSMHVRFQPWLWGLGAQTDDCQNHTLTSTHSEASNLITGIIHKHGLKQYFLVRSDERQAFLCYL